MMNYYHSMSDSNIQVPLGCPAARLWLQSLGSHTDAGMKGAQKSLTSFIFVVSRNISNMTPYNVPVEYQLVRNVSGFREAGQLEGQALTKHRVSNGNNLVYALMLASAQRVSSPLQGLIVSRKNYRIQP